MKWKKKERKKEEKSYMQANDDWNETKSECWNNRKIQLKLNNNKPHVIRYLCDPLFIYWMVMSEIYIYYPNHLSVSRSKLFYFKLEGSWGGNSQYWVKHWGIALPLFLLLQYFFLHLLLFSSSSTDTITLSSTKFVGLMAVPRIWTTNRLPRLRIEDPMKRFVRTWKMK